MNILFVTEFFPEDESLRFTGGVESYNYYLIRALARKNFVTVICQKNSILKYYNQYPFGEDIKVIRVGRGSKVKASFSSVPDRLVFVLSAIGVGLKQDFDVVQGNNFVTYLPAYLIGKLRNKPTVAWYADVFLGSWIKLMGFLAGIIGEMAERISLKLSWDKIIALSNSTKQKLIIQGIPAKKVEVAYAGVDIDFFNSVNTKKSKTFQICTVSRLVSYKRIDLLIKALSIIKAKNSQVKLVIVGEGPEKASLKKLAKDLEVDNLTDWRSNISREELAKTLKSSHLFCLPSEVEGFGMVVLESGCCGLPYIISDIPVLLEITKDARGGLVFRRGDENDLSEKILDLIEDDKKRNQLSKEAYKLASSYSWDKIAEQFEKVYESISRK